MEVGCLEYPGASTIGSQPLDWNNAPKTGTTAQPSHEPLHGAEGASEPWRQGSEKGLLAGRHPNRHRPNPKAYVYATTLDKVPVTEAASQKLPKLIPLGF